MIADRRLSATRLKLAQRHSSAIVVTSVSNVSYLTGFENVFDSEANVALLITSDIACVYTDFRYAEAAEAAAVGTPWIVCVPKESLYIELCAYAAERGIDEVALESSVPYGRFRFVSEQFQGRVEVVDAWIEEIRQVKEAAEIERISVAADLTDRALEHVKGQIVSGARECDIALAIEVFIRQNGGDAVAFDPIVASGPNSSRPHAKVSDRQFEVGDFVTVDLGARVSGYCSDLTRTFVIGSASDRQREIYDAVLAANKAGILAARAGVRGMDIDRAARDALGQHGLAEAFGHGLGHGVGIDVHEMPSVSPRGRDAVHAGSVVTIEPGVYIEGFGGVRIEDLVVIEEGGCRVLSAAPKELIEL
ncbi:MAG: aminopeptidase P family protein [Actinomycetota bacterium]|nr:aminopeptidase P family protein [Actinomycetota bacterium]